MGSQKVRNRKKIEKKMKSAFKNSKSFEDRAQDSAQIKREHPGKTAIIVERASNEKNLPILDKSKFLVPAHVTMHEFTRVLRRRLELSPGQALFLMTQKGMPAGTQSLAELFEKDGDDDGFLYFTYAAQETFG